MSTQTTKTRFTNRHGLDIAVLVEIPENPKGLSFVMHGLKGFKEQDHITGMAATILDAGLISVRFDCTHAYGESGGSIEQASFTTYIEDLEDVINWSSGQEWYSEPFIIAGHSMAGIAILEYCKENAERVLGVAPIAACISGIASYEAAMEYFPEETMQWKENGYKLEASKSKPGRIAKIPWSHMENRLLYNAFDYAHNLTMPIFLFTGSKDLSCPPKHQQILFDTWGGTDKELHIAEGLAHTYRTEEEINVMKDHFAKWLSRMMHNNL